MAKHTPTPWRVEENTDLIWGCCNADDTSSYGMGYPIISGFASFGGWADGRPDYNEKEANAAFIVRAVNAHDDLVDALRLAERELAAVENGSTGGIPNSVIALIPEALEAIRAALAKHGGHPVVTSEVA